MSDRPATDLHVVELVADDEYTVWRATCSCGWQSKVASADTGIAWEQGRKHADRVEKRLYARPINLSLRLDVSNASPDEVKQLIRDAKTGVLH